MLQLIAKLLKLKSAKDIESLKRHGDEIHFKIKRKTKRPAEAMIERKSLLRFHVWIYDGHTIFHENITWPRMLRVISNVENEVMV